jgi:DNA-directed RNA polymerase specialized sigma24 family protein
MSHDDRFSDLLNRLRHGDLDAAGEIVGRYEPMIRVAVRTRLSDFRLRRQFDSTDVCQSILASFFVHVADGAYDLRDPLQLVALLRTMVRKKLAMRARSQYRQCRDARRISQVAVESIVGMEPGPTRQVAARDLLERVLGEMSAEVRAIATGRMRGESWAAIASTLGGTAEARRKQFERAMEIIDKSLDVGVLEG